MKTDRIVVITGAGGGMGRLAVERFLANGAPHFFKNKSGKTVHMLCTPVGLEEFFMSVGVPVGSRDAPPPQLSKEDMAAKGKLAKQLAPKYRIELLV
jgi:NAD(P)-dependent dehydrogenase (short-subunit alcohol dehydrogenase family)